LRSRSSWVKFSSLVGDASGETAASIFAQYIAVAGNGRMLLRVKNNTTSVINKFDEDFKLNGDDPYSGSKAASEIVINSYKDNSVALEKLILSLKFDLEVV
jgi:hypothetical protein